MDDLVSLDTLAEISLGLAGFSGVAAALRPDSFSEWRPSTRMAFWAVLIESLAALFFSLLPSVLHHLGVADVSVWRTSSALLAAFMAIQSVGFGVRGRQMAAVEAPPSAWRNRVIPVLVAVVATVVVLNAFGVRGDPQLGPYFLGVVTLLGLGCSSFVLFLVSDRLAA